MFSTATRRSRFVRKCQADQLLKSRINKEVAPTDITSRPVDAGLHRRGNRPLVRNRQRRRAISRLERAGSGHAKPCHRTKRLYRFAPRAICLVVHSFVVYGAMIQTKTVHGSVSWMESQYSSGMRLSGNGQFREFNSAMRRSHCLETSIVPRLGFRA